MADSEKLGFMVTNIFEYQNKVYDKLQMAAFPPYPILFEPFRCLTKSLRWYTSRTKHENR